MTTTVIPMDNVDKIIAAIYDTSRLSEDRLAARFSTELAKVTTEIGELKEDVAQLDVRVVKLEASTTLRSDHIEKEMAALSQRSKEMEHHSTASLEAELRRRDEERRKWVFYAVTVVVSFLTGGSGFALLSKLVH